MAPVSTFVVAKVHRVREQLGNVVKWYW